MRWNLFLVLFLAVLPVGADTTITPFSGENPDIAWDGSKFGVVYKRVSWLGFVTLDPLASNVSSEMLVGSMTGIRDPVLVFGPGVWASAWKLAGNTNVFFGTFDDAGMLVIPPVQLSDTSTSNFKPASYPSMVWTGARYYVAWQRELDTPNRDKQVELAALDQSGAILVPWKVVVPPDTRLVKIAWNPAAGGLAAAWFARPSPTTFVFDGANLSPSGDLSGSVERLSPPPGSNREGRLAASDSGFVFGCRNALTTGPLNQGDLYITALDADMDPIAGPLPLSNGEDYQRLGNLIWTGAGFIWPLEYFQSNGQLFVYLHRVSAMGELLGPRVRLSDQAIPWNGAQFGPRAAFTGNVVGVVWDAGDFDPLYYDYIPTMELMVGGGAGLGNPAQVKSRSSYQGEPVLDFLPYAAGYGAGVAVADIETNPLDEILTGAGPGPPYGPQVRAFTGGEESIDKVNFFAYGTLKAGVHVSGGDLEQDGTAEILTGAGPMPVFGPHVRGWNYDGGTLQPIPKVNFFAYSTLRYGVEVAGGDIDGDGFAEIVTGPGDGAIFGAHLRAFDYDAAGMSTINKVNAFVFPTSFGLKVGAGDITGDGRDEILAAPGPDPAATTEVQVYAFAGTLGPLGSVEPFPGFFGGSHPAAGDMDLQSGAELAATPGFLPANPGRTKVYSWDGTAFQNEPTWDQDVYPGLGYGATCAIGNVGI